MYLTEREIKDTPVALRKTYCYFVNNWESISEFFRRHSTTKFTFFGSGSSFMLAKSASALFNSFPGTTATAIPAGDYIVNQDFWKEAVRDSIVVTISRSGKTSETVKAIAHIKETLGNPVFSISAMDQNDIMPMSDFNVTLDWCYDRSVCQTRTVTNFYTAILLTAAAYTSNVPLMEAVKRVCDANAEFIDRYFTSLDNIVNMPWKNVTVLADGPLCGIAEEAALAFTEICMLPGRYFHVLDYRHGPVVISDKDTLTLMLINSNEETFQKHMIKDVVSRGGPVITVSKHDEEEMHSTVHIQIKDEEYFAVWGIPLICLAQIIAFKKSIALGGNPDAPTGLTAYITLQ